MDGRKVAHELGGLFLIFWGLFVLLSLLSFDPSDPSLNHVVGGKFLVRNKAGIFGAYLSGFLHDLFGIGAYVWPLAFLVTGGALVSAFFDPPWWRWCGAFLLSLCLLAAGEAFSLRIGDMAGGGVIGRGLYENSRYFLSPAGSSLLWLFLLLTGIRLVCDFSRFSFLQRPLSRARAKAGTTADTASSAGRAEKPRFPPNFGRIGEFLRRGFSERPRAALPPLPMPDIAAGNGASPAVFSIRPSAPSADDALFTPHGGDPAAVAEFPAGDEREAFPGESFSAPAVPDLPRPGAPPTDSTAAGQKAEALPAVAGRVSLPPLRILRQPEPVEGPPPEFYREKGQRLIACLGDFGIEGELARVTTGPVVTMFEVRPAAGVKVARIAGLSDDLALSLKAFSVRIEAPIPGSNTVGIEIPNEIRQTVNFRELLASEGFAEKDLPLAMALGKDIAGRPVIEDLSRMPHLLVAGTTGAGKSVCLNSILLSFLYKLHPEDLRLLLVDPKQGVELGVYEGLPHLAHPVIKGAGQAKTALDWAVHEMDRRYECMARLGARNIAGYNQRLRSYGGRPPEDLLDLEHLPYLVIIIDELAELMLTAPREVENAVMRLAQLARAAGIHMILATQRPSVDIVTGLIKVNLPCRISFQMASKHDSRTILDTVGAAHLLGKGDMLFKRPSGKLLRLQGPFVGDEEVEAVVSHWKRALPPSYAVDFSEWSKEGEENASGGQGGDILSDPLYPEVLRFAQEQDERRVSIGLLQRRFRLGFNRAARMKEQLERDGIVDKYKKDAKR